MGRVRWGQRLLIAAGAVLIASAVWLALAPPSPLEDEAQFGFHGNPCDGSIVQALGGRSDEMLDPTESRVCTTPARKQLVVAAGLLVIGVGLVVAGVRRASDEQEDPRETEDHEWA